MRAGELLADRDHVLVALDGPVAEGLVRGPVAARLRMMVAEDRLPRKVVRTEDPFAVLAYAATIGPATEHAVYAQWCRIEHELVAAARVTPGVREAFAALAAGGTRITVVGSLDVGAIRAFLVLHGLVEHVGRVAGRSGSDPAVLPPAPDLVATAVLTGATPAEACAFVGTLPVDLAAARAAGVDAIRHRRPTPDPDAVVPTWFDALTTARRA
ncbi:HAD hydrolase-like protein [Umezawaea tangerina]|uniref:Phosphoglycolate phosphatase-like HAD superfamily hydrolase n=1 Tax=Umezawaea tangerina TaxID=84725 RepID=A0A2T0SZN5_9PSEU|nr:HAD hydrolase-like protein [Umezawaea tangerina]PRY38823.1 phosphoglycolate phosphatase-like HAD superfamily hydrolase [Umezawaea tangerina]